MKNTNRYELDITKYQLTELTDAQKQETDGGVIPFLYWLGLGVAAAACVGKNVVDNWQCFKDGLNGRKHDYAHCGR
jgi:hypothetical protein